MPIFYSAADIYILPAFSPGFGGLDVSWVEALGCNKSVLCSQLKFLDFDYNDLGICIDYINKFNKKTEWMKNTYKRFTKSHEVAQKHPNGNTSIMFNLNKIYEKILNKSLNTKV